MSAAASTRPKLRPGWLEIGPGVPLDRGINEDGFSQTPQPINTHGYRVAGPALGLVNLLVGATIGRQRRSVQLTLEFFSHRFKTDKRTIQLWIAILRKAGVLDVEGEEGEIPSYRLDFARFLIAPDYEPPKPQLCKRPNQDEDDVPEPPRARFVADIGALRTRDGQPIEVFSRARLLIAEQPNTATVAKCGACGVVGVDEMVPAEELERGGGRNIFHPPEEKAKAQPRAALSHRNGRASQPPGATERDGRRTPPAGQTARPVDEQAPVSLSDGSSAGPLDQLTSAIQQKLSERYKGVGRFSNHARWGGCPPADARKVAAKLGPGIPIDEFLDYCDQVKGWKIKNQAQTWAIFARFAADFRPVWEAQKGIPCPCGSGTRVKPGVQCAACGKQPKPKPKPQRGQQQAWEAVKRRLYDALARESYGNWIARTWLVSNGGQSFVVGVPDGHTLTWVTEDLAGAIATAIEDAHGPGYEVTYEVHEE